jgi:2,4-dienoyl-CoA reductase-like NADH-dependent reductase (Old Yellow Enzyme family)
MMNVLFTPYTIGTLELQNRFIRSATHEYMASEDGFVTDKMLDFYERLARGRIGLIIPGFAYVHPSGKSSPRQAGIYDDKFIPGFRKLVDVIHREGSKVALQIVHGGRQCLPEECGGTPLAPSAVEDSSVGLVPQALMEQEILEIKDAFVRAAERVRRAGFDAVQLHCAHGFLLSEFISPHTNRRTDKWGGSTENRTRLIVEIVHGIRHTLGRDYPVLVKLNSEDGLKRGGLTPRESVKVARLIAQAGIDAIEVSGGIREAGAVAARLNILSPEKEAYFRKAAAKIKAATGLPVALVGGIRSRGVMESLITSGTADLISMSRPFIREPDLVVKMQDQNKQIADCISCNGCFDPNGIRCALISDKDADV